MPTRSKPGPPALRRISRGPRAPVLAFCVTVVGVWSGDPARAVSNGRALIVVGLPGDAAHEARFAETATQWVAWLTGPDGFKTEDVRVLGAPGGRGPASREAVAREFAAIRVALGKDDRLWVFWLGHANADDGHAYLHLPGPDLRDDEFAALFRGVTCREQVVWVTSTASGWFVKALSAPGRIVIAATERDQEINETEFPHALAAVVARPRDRLDADRDGRVSVSELYRAVVAEVGARFAADRRVPTEHAQLDDNGDGVGTEAPGGPPAPPGQAADGAPAAKTFVPFRN